MKTLYRVKGIDHDLVVTREGRKITLWAAPGIRHSVMDLGAPHWPGLEYARSMLLTLAFNPEANSFLMLGLGGGSIAAMLGAARPGAAMDAVEIDPAVPDLARRFFFWGAPPCFRIYLEDAASYISSCVKRYDVIILDAYTGDAFPAQCSTCRFFEQARDRLSPEGVLVVNWMPGDQERYRRLLANIEGSFGRVWLLHSTVSKNKLLFATLRERNRKKLLAAAERLQRELPFGSDVVRQARRLKPRTAGKASGISLHEDRL